MFKSDKAAVRAAAMRAAVVASRIGESVGIFVLLIGGGLGCLEGRGGKGGGSVVVVGGGVVVML